MSSNTQHKQTTKMKNKIQEMKEVVVDHLVNYTYGFAIDSVEVVDDHNLLVTCQGDQWLCTIAHEEDRTAGFNLHISDLDVVQMRNLD